MDCIHRDNYHVWAATNLLGIRPWDETVLTETEDIDAFAVNMAWYFSCEIILLGSASYVSLDGYENISLWICGDESGSIAEADSGERGSILAEGVEDSSVYAVYGGEISDV